MLRSSILSLGTLEGEIADRTLLDAPPLPHQVNHHQATANSAKKKAVRKTYSALMVSTLPRHERARVALT